MAKKHSSTENCVFNRVFGANVLFFNATLLRAAFYYSAPQTVIQDDLNFFMNPSTELVFAYYDHVDSSRNLPMQKQKKGMKLDLQYK